MMGVLLSEAFTGTLGMDGIKSGLARRGWYQRWLFFILFLFRIPSHCWVWAFSGSIFAILGEVHVGCICKHLGSWEGGIKEWARGW
jgi:hypothetical protein